MKQLFFVVGMIWILTSVGSLLLAPLVGFDKQRTKTEILEFWGSTPLGDLTLIFRRAALCFSWIGFLFPLIYPIVGFVGSLIFLYLV